MNQNHYGSASLQLFDSESQIYLSAFIRTHIPFNTHDICPGLRASQIRTSRRSSFSLGFLLAAGVQDFFKRRFNMTYSCRNMAWGYVVLYYSNSSAQSIDKAISIRYILGYTHHSLESFEQKTAEFTRSIFSYEIQSERRVCSLRLAF